MLYLYLLLVYNKNYLQHIARSSKDAVAVRKLRGIYKSCINVAQIEQRGDAPLQKLLGRLGGFPMLDGVFRKTHFNLNLAIAKYMNNGFMVRK